MRFNLSDWALSHRSLVIYLMIVSVAAGLLAYYRLGRNEDPSFVIKTMVVSAAWPGATMEDTLKQVTERLERKLEETPGIDFLRSYTTPRRHDDLRQPEAVRARRRRCRTPGIRSATSSPTSATRCPRASSGRSSTTASATRSASSTASPPTASRRRELRDQVEDDPLAAAARSRRLEDRDHRRAGRAHLRRVLDPGARQSRHRPRRAARGPAERRTSCGPPAPSRPTTSGSRCGSPAPSGREADILNVNFPVGDRMVRLADIATVRRGFADPPQPMFRVNGQEAIGLGIAMRDGGDILALGENIKDDDGRASPPTCRSASSRGSSPTRR